MGVNPQTFSTIANLLVGKVRVREERKGSTSTLLGPIILIICRVTALNPRVVKYR